MDWHPKLHIVFVDDDHVEVDTFSRLYGDMFRVTAIRAMSLETVVADIQLRLSGTVPDLFVLDLFFPLVSNPPVGLSAQQAAEGRAALIHLQSTVADVKKHFGSAPDLLRNAHGVVVQAERLMYAWCEVFSQSAQGGIGLLKQLNELYRDTPKVFYSRKANIDDLKQALAAGALDVLKKPHPSTAAAEAPAIAEKLIQAARWTEPQFLAGWRKNVNNKVKLT